MSSEEESTDLPSIAERSKRPNTSKPTGRHNVFTHFQTMWIVKFVRSRTLPDLLAGTAATADHKVRISVCSIVTQSRYGMASGTGSARHGLNWRRRIREGPQPAKRANTFYHGVAPQQRKGEVTSCRGTVKSAW